MTIEEMQAQLDALQKALDERKAQLATRSATKRVGDLEWEHEVVVGLTHEEAVAHAEQRGEGFRLPTLHELLSTVDYGCHDPACSVLPATPSVQVWSATMVSNNSKRWWVVAFGGGSVHGIEAHRHCGVRLVRSAVPKPGQVGLFDRSSR